MYTARFSERAELLGKINPASYNSEQNTGYLSLENFHRAVVIVETGVIGGNLDIDIEEGTDTSGTGAQAFDGNGKDTSMTATTDNNSVLVIEIRTEECDVDDNYSCINVEVTPASAGIFAVQVWGLEPRYATVSTTGITVVD